ncbi:nucleotidyltransferase family protein [Nonomuraea typhae]|uniref:Nucleotidyltransferase family protein n=1 Tax=Nonomuraea typhae TaxID=2603600 RepID=A0ABW7ZB77_9ACTN
MPPEWLGDFLLEVSKTPMGEDSRERAARIAKRADFDEGLIVREATRHKVLPVVASNLACLRDETPRLSRVIDAARQKKESVRTLWGEFGNTIRGVNACGLSPVVLKGPAWASTYYPSPLDRSFGDIDLFVEPEHLDRYGDALRSLGYSQSTFDPKSGTITPLAPERIAGALATGRHAAPFIRFDEDSGSLFVVELHAPGFDENFHRVDTRCFLEDAVEWPVEEAQARRLSRVDDVVYCAAHLWKDLYVCSPQGAPAAALLHGFCDLRQMFLAASGDEHWRGLYDRAHHVRKCDPVFFAVTHLDRLYPGVVPRSLLDPPGQLTKDPETVIDDVWRFSVGSSTFRERLFDPHVDERRFTKLRDRGEAGGQLTIPHHSQEAARVILSGTIDPPAWQFFRTHVTYGATPAGDREFSAEVRLSHSAEHLHVSVSVSDPVQVFDKRNGFYYAQDSVQILFECPLGSGRLDNIFLVPAAADLPEPAVVRHHAGLERAGTEPVPGASISAEFSPEGYRMHADLPKAEVIPGLATGEWFGLDVVVYESGPAGEERRSVLQWSGGRNSIRNPAFYGRAELAGSDQTTTNE